MKSIVLVIFIILFFDSISQNKKSKYSSKMHFYSQVFNKKTETNIFIEFDKYQLLKKKNFKTGKFEYSYNIQIKIFHNKTKLHLDTLSRTFYKNVNESDMTNFIDSFKIGRRNYDFQYEITLTDLNKNLYTFHRKNISPSNHFSEIHFLKRNMNYIPIISMFHEESEFKIQSNKFKDTMISTYFFRKSNPAPPPFIFKSPTLNFGSADSLGKIFFDTNGMSQTIRFNKTVVLSHNQLSSNDYFITYKVNRLFPYFENYIELIKPLKYFTTRKEYNEMINSNDKRLAFESFWLKIAGNKITAKSMIKAYYNRVIYSNKKFSSFKEGWKSDRGLLYIIFGEPRYIETNNNEIKWVYGERYRGGINYFIFYKSLNNLPNDYELERSETFKSQWYIAVENWRSGVVYYK